MALLLLHLHEVLVLNGFHFAFIPFSIEETVWVIGEIGSEHVGIVEGGVLLPQFVKRRVLDAAELVAQY
jgi:hypothetical protein